MNMLDNIKYVFQIPLAWFRAVNAFCFGSYGGNLIRITRGKDGAAAFDVDENELAQLLPKPKGAGTPSSVGSFPTDDGVTQQASTLWTAGGENGASLFVLFKGEYDSGDGVHDLYAAKLTITADGRIVKIEAVGNGGVKIGA